MHEFAGRAKDMGHKAGVTKWSAQTELPPHHSKGGRDGDPGLDGPLFKQSQPGGYA